ncbi:hypothetical protein GUJ93_ZPchr0006g44600 [Zizania palustris]|uniref:Uncharacterized protein n=1 Tax=Zizania palustris TaxID=103762 RepID=A0A8J5SPR5_ZIZPA|nr:hypothetical protein GUJ93_ZPchr0006g44600 [Zizania palustris]
MKHSWEQWTALESSSTTGLVSCSAISSFDVGESSSFSRSPTDDGSNIEVGDNQKGEENLKSDKNMGGEQPQGLVESDRSCQENDRAIEGKMYNQNVGHADCVTKVEDKMEFPEFREVKSEDEVDVMATVENTVGAIVVYEEIDHQNVELDLGS